MPIDIRATVTCSLGPLISGSISDDYVQGTGLIKTRGTCELRGLFTPTLGTNVTFSYTKGGVTRTLPRYLKVLSSFADPFRRTTKVELGCALTYYGDNREPIRLTTGDDPANADYTESDTRIVTLPISAQLIASRCLTGLNIGGGAPLSNMFSVESFDLSGGYANILSDLLVSENYCGYMGSATALTTFSLGIPAGGYPVLDQSKIIDIDKTGFGALPGESVTVSYSTLKLKKTEQPGTDQPVGTVKIRGTAKVFQVLTANAVVAGAAGAITYQWLANGSAIENQTSQSLFLTQSREGQTISVTASYTDFQGQTQTLTSEGVQVQEADSPDPGTDPSKGAIKIEGISKVGQTLTATLLIPGITGQVSRQWFSNNVAITGQVSTSLFLTPNLEGTTVTFAASYTDNQGQAQTITSEGVQITSNSEIRRLNWEQEEVQGIPSIAYVENPFWASNPFPFSVPRQFEYKYQPRSVVVTEYDTLDRVTKRTTTEYTILAVIAPSYIQHIAGTSPQNGPSVGTTEFTIVSTESYKYKVPAPLFVDSLNKEEPPQDYDVVEEVINEVKEPYIKINASTTVYSKAGALSLFFDFKNSNSDTFIAERRITRYETAPSGDGTNLTKTLESLYMCSAYTIQGQQQLVDAIESISVNADLLESEAARILLNASELVSMGTQTTISKGREVNLQTRPTASDRTNAANVQTESEGENETNTNNIQGATQGNTQNGSSIEWSTESTAEFTLALGSASATRRIDLRMPCAPDDIFVGPPGGPYSSIASDAAIKARSYGITQNRLLLGNRNGMSIQTAPELLPSAPFSGFVVQAGGLSALYATNGTSWTFSSDGIVASTDALFWAPIGGTGEFWFPVAPGITTLPTTPPVVNGQMTVTDTVPIWNETLKLTGRTRTICSVVGLPFALQVTTPLTLVTKTKASVVSVLYVNAPAASVALAALAPAVSTGASVAVPVAAVTVAAVAPAVQTALVVEVPAATVTVAALVPEQVGRPRIEVAVPVAVIELAGLPPVVLTGTFIEVPAAQITITGLPPRIGGPDFWSSWAQQNYGWWPESYGEWWAN